MNARAGRILLAPVRAWARWVEFLSKRDDAAPLAVARIVSGSTIAFHLALMWWSGAAREAWVDVHSGGARPGWAEPWLHHFGGLTLTNVEILIAVGVVSGTLMTFGVATRLTTILTWFLFHTLTDANDFAGGSSDDLLLNGIFILIFSGCGRALSVDQWIRRKRDPNASCEAPVWPCYVLIFQIVMVYWTTGLQKVSNSWWPWPLGSLDALWYILQQSTWIRFSLRDWIAPFYKLTQLASLATWSFENGAPLLLLAFWYRRTRERPGRVRAFFNAPLARFARTPDSILRRLDFRLLYLALGFSIHLGIWVLMEVGPFFNSVLVCYACCITPAEYRAVIAFFRARLARGAPAANPSAPIANP